MNIPPDTKDNAVKVSEALLLMSRRLAEAANSDDLDTLKKELQRLGEGMEQAGALLLLSAATKGELTNA